MKDLYHYGPSLSVKFYADNKVLASVGPFIHVFKYTTGELLHRVRIFKRNKIHGFALSPNLEHCVLYGGKSVLITSIETLLSQEDLTEKETLACEWIVSGAFSFHNDKIYLLTCYNLVFVVDYQGAILERKFLANERSILYSGSIKVLSENKVLINAGTVMGGVLVWDLHSQSKLHNLQGHEGSIFFVSVSDNGKLITSCSDDRSIILWDMNTGNKLSTGWGHTARIWNLKFFANDTKLISVSEDCTCRVWNIVQNKLNEYTLEQTDIFEVHLIKNVWGVDVNEKDMIACTSGNDGRIKMIDLSQSCRYGDENEVFDVSEISHAFDIPLEKKELIKGFEWFEFGLLAITSFGKILQYDKQTKVWSFLKTADEFASYPIINGITNETDDNVVILCNNKSDLLLMNFDDTGKTIKSENSVHISGLSKATNIMPILKDTTSFYLTMESPNPRDKFLILEVSFDNLQIINRFEFIKPINFVSSCLSIYGNFILVGSRFSTIAIFDLGQCDDTNYSPFVIRKINAGDTMTSIRFVESTDGKQLFSVTNRDGFFNFISIRLDELQNCNNPYKIIHSNKIMKGFLEGGFYNDKGEYITYGFKSSLFYMYNEQNGYEIVSQVCGGAHRQWKLSKLSKNQDGSFILIYLKASGLYFRKIYKPFNPETLVNGFHGREIRDLSIRSNVETANGNYIFVTGSEDTSIKLNELDIITGTMKPIWTQRKHVSGLQRLKFISQDLLISCSAREELFLWEIDDTFRSNPYITVRQTLPTSSDNPDLRIMDFDIKFIDDTKKDFLLTTVYSDSAIRIWHYDFDANNFSLKLSTMYQTCCIFNTAMVEFENRLLLIIAPTNGYLVIYDITNFLNKDYQPGESKLVTDSSTVVHQSGIKAMDVQVMDNKLKLYTGGDDNGLALTILQYNEDMKLVQTFQTMQESTASSTITSCQLLDSNKLITTSVDQVIRVWDVTEDELILVKSKYTTIADTGSCDVLPAQNLALIGGVGLSSWQL